MVVVIQYLPVEVELLVVEVHLLEVAMVHQQEFIHRHINKHKLMLLIR